MNDFCMRALIYFFGFLMSVELTRVPLEDLLAEVKLFKRNCEIVVASIGECQYSKAFLLYQKEQNKIG